MVKWSECEGDCVLGLSVCARAWALFLFFMHVYYFILARCVLSHSIFDGFLGVF